METCKHSISPHPRLLNHAFYLLCVCDACVYNTYMCKCKHVPWWGSEDNFGERVLTFYHGFWVIKLSVLTCWAILLAHLTFLDEVKPYSCMNPCNCFIFIPSVLSQKHTQCRLHWPPPGAEVWSKGSKLPTTNIPRKLTLKPWDAIDQGLNTPPLDYFTSLGLLCLGGYGDRTKNLLFELLSTAFLP